MCADSVVHASFSYLMPEVCGVYCEKFIVAGLCSSRREIRQEAYNSADFAPGPFIAMQADASFQSRENPFDIVLLPQVLISRAGLNAVLECFRDAGAIEKAGNACIVYSGRLCVPGVTASQALAAYE
jgi:hypothetical protein